MIAVAALRKAIETARRDYNRTELLSWLSSGDLRRITTTLEENTRMAGRARGTGWDRVMKTSKGGKLHPVLSCGLTGKVDFRFETMIPPLMLTS